jgi:5-methylcytosine-specific restriction endonuclease McrA
METLAENRIDGRKKVSLEKRKKMSYISKKLGLIPPSRKGIPNSEEAKKKISLALKGKKKSPEHVEKVRQALIKRADRLGRKVQREKHNANWQYKYWRKEVFKRDNYTCWICEEIGGTLNAHHLFSWAKYPELRYHVPNGLTLCETCHKTYG